MVRKRRLSKVRRFAISQIADSAMTTRGRRFQDRYDRRQAKRASPAKRTLRICFGLLLFLIGIANAFIPGPGGSVFIFASAFVLSSESQHLARLLDRSEVRFERQVNWMLRHPLLVGAIISIIIIILFITVGYVITRYV